MSDSEQEDRSRTQRSTGSNSDGLPDEPSRETLRARVSLLEEENRRLRVTLADTKRTTHRRTAIGFAVVGGIALVGAALFPAYGTVLLALAGTGAFAGVLLWFLTPERFVARSYGERIHDAAAATLGAVVAELDLAERRIYVPVPGEAPARLFIPQYGTGPLPPADALTSFFVDLEDETRRGISVVPSGATLFPALENAIPVDLETEASEIAEQVTEAIVQDFEFAAEADVDVEAGRVTARFEDVAFDPDAIDTPVVSLMGVALAIGLDEPVETEQSVSEDGGLVVGCTVGNSDEA